MMNATLVVKILDDYKKGEAPMPVVSFGLVTLAGCTAEEAILLMQRAEEEMVVDAIVNAAKESEEEEILQLPRPDDCVCSDQAFEVYGCMCQTRRMPG